MSNEIPVKISPPIEAIEPSPCKIEVYTMNIKDIKDEFERGDVDAE